MNLDKRLLSLARGGRLFIALTIGLGFAGGVVTVLQARSLSQVVTRVFLENQGLQQLSDELTFLFGVILLRACLVWASEAGAGAASIHLRVGLRQQVMEHLYALGPAYVKQERTGELASTAYQGIEALDAYFSQYLPQLALAALVPLTILLFVFPLDPLSGIVMLLTAPLIPLFMLLIGNMAQAATRRQWQTLSRLNAYFLDVLQGLTTLKMLGASRRQIKTIEQVSERFRMTTMNVLRITFLSALTLEMVATLSTAVVAVEIGLRLLYNRLLFEQALLILLLAPEFYLPLRLLGTRFHAGMSGVAAAKSIFKILDQPAARGLETESQGNIPTPGVKMAGAPTIHVQGVRYSYADGRLAVEDASFKIGAGQKVALVGPSGAGKSTLAALLLRFVEPQDGQIYINDQPLQTIPLHDWRASLAWVSEHPYLFNDTVAANLRLGRPDADLEEVIQAAKLAHAHEFIQQLPDGYNTIIGERGSRLSGGQAQRIALGRAFLKNTPVVILDEATANLDAESEALLGDSMQRLLTGRTALIIAHRLATAQKADRILVLERGRVIEQGSHEDLIKAGGLYHRLVMAYTGSTGLQVGNFFVAPSQVFTAQRQFPARSTHPASNTLPRKKTSPPFIRLLAFTISIKRWIAFSAVMGFMTVASGVGLMATSAYLISAAALHPSIAALQVPIVAVRFFGIGRGLFRYLERMISHQTTFRLLARLRVWLYTVLEPLAPARLVGYHSGDLLARIQEDIESLENFYVRALAPPLVAALVAGAVCLYLTGFDPRLAVALLSFMLLAGIGTPLIAYLLSRETGRRLVSLRAILNTRLVDSLQGMAELLAFNQTNRVLAGVGQASLELAKLQQRLTHISALQSASLNLLANLAMWAVLVLAIPLVTSNQIQGVYLAMLLLVALTSFEAIQPLPLAAQYLERDLQSARRLFEIGDTEPEVIDPAKPSLLYAPSSGLLPISHGKSWGERNGPAASRKHPLRSHLTAEGISLEVHGLCFRYPPLDPGLVDPTQEDKSLPLEENTYAINGLDFELAPGEHMAIVGPSGAGKSTLVSLLLRFWEYHEGQILLNGEDIRRYRQEDLRSLISAVTQNTFLFHASVRDNLLVAQPTASLSEIIQACEKAQIHAFIQSLPDGYDTWIGEQGLLLSGGERQRLAIARALLRDTPWLILDEATANLDAITECEVSQAIRELRRGRTTLTFTHRLAGLEDMDEILVLNRGRLVERGTQAELLLSAGLYRHMWELQNQLITGIFERMGE